MAAMTLLMMAACTENLGVYDTPGDDENISFAVTDIEVPSAQRGTRGTAMTSPAAITSFGVSAGVYPSGQDYTANACGNFFYCLNALPYTPTGYSWPTADYRMSFYAYHPYGNSNLTVSPASGTGLPTYTYTVPTTIAQQVDVMTAQVTNRECSNRSSVVLNFGHRCTDIRFEAYNQSGAAITVNSVSVYGVKYRGTWRTGTAWTLTGTANSASSHPFTLSLSTSVAAKSTVNLTGTSNHFILLPQVVPAGTEMFVITTTEKGSSKTYTYTLPEAMTLQMGKTYTFQLNLGGNGLVLNPVVITDWLPIDPLIATFSVNNWSNK